MADWQSCPLPAQIVDMVRRAGARKVYLASASPPVKYPNVYGVDMPSKKEFVANGLTDDEVGGCASSGCTSGGMYCSCVDAMCLWMVWMVLRVSCMATAGRIGVLMSSSMPHVPTLSLGSDADTFIHPCRAERLHTGLRTSCVAATALCYQPN